MSGLRYRRLIAKEDGAVSATVALSLFALVAVGGIAFDYARMATLDTELQAAADQAALAAASQLDGKDGACTRAGQAARELVANQTRFSNDGGGMAIVIATETECDAVGNIRFYQDRDRTTAATSEAEAKFVEVQVNDRAARYALTPVIGVLTSGNMTGIALAGLGSAICRVPPVMICNPQESTGNSDFDLTGLIGAGLNLVSVGDGNGGWAPGNFGYLDSHGGSNGAQGLREALGWITPPGDCQEITGVDTKPGANTSVTDALNTRFDIYDTQSCPAGGSCPPSANSVKDLVRLATGNGNGNGKGNGNGNENGNENGCRIHNQGWQLPAHPYLPSSATEPMTASEIAGVDAMGYPRDMCHAVSANGSCAGGRVGNGAWDRDAYFAVNYGTGFNWRAAMSARYGTDAVTRYEVYNWELANMGNATVPVSRQYGTGGDRRISWRGPVCNAPGLTPGPNSVDRRRISAAVVNCTANSVRGNSTSVPVEKWIDLFLVEPSVARARTSAGDVYAEIIGETSTGAAGATAGQVVRRDVPYLIR